MEKYIIYKFDPLVESGKFNVVTIKEAFSLMGVRGTDLPNLEIKGFNVNQGEIEQEMNDCELLRLIYKNEEWIITKIW